MVSLCRQDQVIAFARVPSKWRGLANKLAVKLSVPSPQLASSGSDFGLGDVLP